MLRIRVFLIKDEYDTYGYLKYSYDLDKFYIKFFDDVFRYGHTPAMVGLYVKTGRQEVKGEEARYWVQCRLIPPNRQNIADILAANGLVNYSEIELLAIPKGRCDRDTIWLDEVKPEYLKEIGILDDIERYWG